MTDTVRVILMDHEGSEYCLEVLREQTIMEAAVIAGVPGILAECGGSPQCGSCSVIVPEAWRDKLGEPEELEIGVLRFNNKDDGQRRLTCQLIPEPEWDGLILHLPESQY